VTKDPAEESWSQQSTLSEIKASENDRGRGLGWALSEGHTSSIVIKNHFIRPVLLTIPLASY